MFDIRYPKRPMRVCQEFVFAFQSLLNSLITEGLTPSMLCYGGFELPLFVSGLRFVCMHGADFQKHDTTYCLDYALSLVKVDCYRRSRGTILIGETYTHSVQL